MPVNSMEGEFRGLWEGAARVGILTQGSGWKLTVVIESPLIKGNVMIEKIPGDRNFMYLNAIENIF